MNNCYILSVYQISPNIKMHLTHRLKIIDFALYFLCAGDLGVGKMRAAVPNRQDAEHVTILGRSY